MTLRRTSPVEGGRDAAQALAIEALSFLAAEPERLRRFLDICGLGPQNLRAAAGEPRFLVSVIDYLAGDERLMLEFAKLQGLDPRRIPEAARALNGRSDREAPS